MKNLDSLLHNAINQKTDANIIANLEQDVLNKIKTRENNLEYFLSSKPYNIIEIFNAKNLSYAASIMIIAFNVFYFSGKQFTNLNMESDFKVFSSHYEQLPSTILG